MNEQDAAQPVPAGLPVALLSLGCPKNLVDSENMSGIMMEVGCHMVADPADAKVIVVNTCGFIESAVQEAIDTILNMADYKNEGGCDFLIVTGCLSQRYHRDMADSLPEVDAILGTRSYAEIADVIRCLYERKNGGAFHRLADQTAGSNLGDGTGNLSAIRSIPVDHEQPAAGPLVRRSADSAGVLAHLRTDHPVSTGAYAYLKIAEGCDNRCAYCAIPGIRGRLRSRAIEVLVEEAGNLCRRGASELILVGQDTTAYGRDLYGERRLSELLRRLAALEAVEQIRFLYAYADGMTDELLDVMASKPKILPYIDLPVQHASDAVLKRMRRTDTEAGLRKTFARIRSALPHAIFRTTVMVGFPGETEADFDILKQFVSDLRFHHLGCFVFSPETGTAAYKMPDQILPEVAEARYNSIMSIQQPIALAHHRALLNQVRTVLIEGVSEDGIFYTGRIPEQAPDVDTKTYVASEKELVIGKRYPIRIVDAAEYEITGVPIELTK